MINERKCHACGKWTDGNKTHCIYCNALTDPVLIAKEKSITREKEHRAVELAKESKTVRKFKALKHSEKLLHRILYGIFEILFTIYMGILSFIVWLIAMLTA